jgi:hypothetical protein
MNQKLEVCQKPETVANGEGRKDGKQAFDTSSIEIINVINKK